MRLAVFEGYSGWVEDTLAAQVKSVTVQTTYGPDLKIDRPFEPAPPGTGDAVTRAMKPRIVIQLAGGNPVTWSPYGDPRPSRWPLVKLAGLALVGIVLFGYAWKTGAPPRR